MPNRPPDDPGPPPPMPLRVDQDSVEWPRYQQQMKEWEEAWQMHNQKLEEERLRERREANERYAANPVEFIGHLSYRYTLTDHGALNKRDQLYRLGDDFVYGHLSRALGERVKSGDVAELTRLVVKVKEAIEKQLPDSAFRRQLLKKVDSKSAEFYEKF